MKHFIITGLFLTALLGSQALNAQNKQSYEDDIYYNSKSQPKATTKAAPAHYQQQAEPAPAQTESAPVYNSSDYSRVTTDENSTEYQNSTGFQTHTGTYFQTYETGDYQEEDNTSYTSQINHFYHPWYDQPYWSTCYYPYGYSPWYAPGFSFGFSMGWGYGYGYGGMYWGVGFPYYPYYPTWGYPYYPYYPYGGYCGYGGYGGYPVSYGPRYSSNTVRNDYAHGYRPTRPVTTGEKSTTTVTSTTSNAGFNSANNSVRFDQSGGQRIDRTSAPTTELNAITAPAFNDSRTSPAVRASQPAYNNSGMGTDRPVTEVQAPAQFNSANQSPAYQEARNRTRGDRGGLFGNTGGDRSVRAVESAPRTQSTFSQPRVERSFSSPRTSPSSGGGFGGGGGRGSFGGGGGGGGSFGGGMRGGGRR